MTWLSNENMGRICRLLVAIFGGYAFTAGYIASLGTGLSGLGMAPEEAVRLGVLTGLPLYAALAIWIVATKFPLRVTVLVIATAALLVFCAPWFIRAV